MSPTPFEIDISHMIWDSRYRYHGEGGAGDRTVQDSWRRVARALAGVEVREQSRWEQRFLELLDGFGFLPGGRILAGAGTGFEVTLFNCFVMGEIEDSMEGIFDALKEGALTMQQGGGVGYDFSTLRPAGTPAGRVGGVASGPVSFMRIWDGMCQTLLSTATRRGAMMATLRCDHPDIAAFIDAKQEPGELTNFNLSVLVSDAFMQAVEEDADWPLVFPVEGLGGAKNAAGDELVERQWSGQAGPVPCRVLHRLRARDLWRRIMRSNYENSEPGVLFIDRINRENNLGYRETISATNPCGEIPLPPYGACNLGSLNLTRFVRQPFRAQASLDLEALAVAAGDAVRLLDNVTDLSHFPLRQQREQALASRRVGLGVTGLADALIMLGLHYGSETARELAVGVMQTVSHGAYRASIALAAEKGSYPLFDRGECLERPFIKRLPEDLRAGIAAQGLRNSHLIAIAPTGTISLLANNISSGVEPVFDLEYRRRIRGSDGLYAWYELQDYSVRLWRRVNGDGPLPAYFVNAHALSPEDHLAMQAALQPFVDNAISKTINLPPEYDFEAMRSLYQRAYRAGLKGCTIFRSSPAGSGILRDSESREQPPGPHCCGLDREGS
jgi:ribonucleoside-diphosphate reductase alpha chain